VHEDVLWLEIAVDDSHEMQVLKSKEHLGRVKACQRLRQPVLVLPLEEGEELAAGAVLPATNM
jgi:hypothetical protein